MGADGNHAAAGGRSRFGAISVVLLMCFTILGNTQPTRAVKQNPLKDPRICGRPQCDRSNRKFGYVDALYKYDYTVDLRTEFSGTGDNTSDLYLKASLDLFFPKPCEGFLRINDVHLWDSEQSADSEIPAPEEEHDVYDYYTDSTEANQSLNENQDDSNKSNQHPRSTDLNKALKKNLLRFAFHDGLISEVCPSSDEAVWVLNIKKGILSALQNTMMRFDVDFNTTETDVAGTCNVAYTLESTDNVFVTISKVKDITSCRNRYATHSVLQTTPYNFRDDKTIWPILKSENYCNMTIDHNLYREISCMERHQLIPFSNSSTGAVTSTRSTLTLKGEESYSSGEFLTKNNNIIERRSPLIFDHTPAVKPTHGEIKASRELLKEICVVGFPNIQREFIDVYTNFLQTTKSLDYKALTQLLARSASICENGKNHVLESLPYIGSTASYQVMRDQIIDHAISTSVAHSWMTTLSFIQRPDEETLETFYTILEFSRRKIDPEYTLCASAVIHTYCKYNSDCALNLRVKRITNLLETDFLSLFNMYHGERRTRERMLVILKGLGNIGVISDQFVEQLQEIIAEEDIAPIDIRLQAVLTFRRVDCLKYREFFMDTYANFSINSELRIYSYLQAMRCPDYRSMGAIKNVLEQEEVNQVGSYVWSHLKNVAKSSSPVRIEAQGLLLNDDLSDKFKLDIRKFSRNYERSLFFDEYNFGSTTDMNLIFGTDSYLPRIASVNFTADLFGQSVNFFELSARAEGFEELATLVFGPKGPLNRDVFRKRLSFLNRWLGSESAEDDDALDSFLNIDNLRLKRGAENTNGEEENDDDYEYDFEDDSDLTRSKRSTLTEAPETRKASLQKDVDNFGYKLKYNYNKPRAQIGFRVFGNDLRYYSLEGLVEIMYFFKEFDPFYQAAKILSGKEVTYSKSNVFLDASYSVPLSIGLPLSINTFGASSIDLRISGNLDRLEPNTEWHFNVEGKFKPSVSVDVITTMQSDMFYALSGIRVKSNLYSNSEVEAKLKVRGRNLVSFSFNLPQDKNEIFSARSELLVMKDIDEEIPQNGIENRRSNSSCTWPALDDAIGLKMCSFYSVPDLTHTSDTVYPSLLLSGPLNFSVVLMKSDLTAKSFVFEYKWDQQDNDSDWSLIFHTPGSTVKRLLVANVSTTPEAFNTSVSFVNGAKEALAGCNYKGDPDYRKLDIFLDANGNRSLDFNMELQRWQDRTVSIYKPKLLLAVNGVNITGLVGTIRINKKNGIMQNDIEISFETRKLQALLKGNIVQSEITTSTNMTVNYRFQANKVEAINLVGKLVNKNDKSKTEYRGNVKLKTTAYPKLNFASNATWVTLQGHTEGIVTYNNAPNLKDPNYTSTMRLVFARSHSDDLIWEGSRTRASLELTVPRSNVDFRILMKHEERFKNGTEHNFILGLKYATEKEATALFSVHLPRRSLFSVDAYMNVSIPDFNSCTARVRLNERLSKDYMINLNGTWFTGHSLSIKGNYKDKSSRVQALHHLKLIAESPSFEATTLNIVYRRNQLLIFADVQAKYSDDPYGLTIQYAGNADNRNTNAEFRIKVKDKDYWLSTKLLSEQPKLLQVELHLDKIRDMHLQVGLLSLAKRKELSVELKWDANRDPSQRLGLLAEYNRPDRNKYDGNVMITYPDRTISCGFDAYTGGPRFYGTARASWSITELLVFTYDAGLMPGKDLHNWIHAELTTPFEGWRKNSVKAGVYSAVNLFLVNSSLLWADNQTLQLGYKSDFIIADPLISFDVRLGMNSSVKDIPTISVKLNHLQNVTKFDSGFDLRYSTPNETLNVYSLKSSWETLNTPEFQNISGTVLMLSPFEGYRKGGLAAKFSLSDKHEVRGAASLNFDIREFTLAMDGYVKKFTNNMLSINITTPLEKFRTIHGRFGLNERQHHAVAEIRAPIAALGFEVLCDITSLMSFDVKLSIATPMEGFQQAAIIAKVKSDTVDLRGTWNNATLGFIGVSRLHNITDFEYACRVFTPLLRFEENGFVAKFIKKQFFVLELHGKLSDYKLGLKMNGHPKSKLLQQLGGSKLEFEIVYDEDFQPLGIEDGDEDYDIDEIDFFSYFVDFELDTLVWPTINGFVDVQEIKDFYLIVGNLELPQGRVDIKDRLYFPDFINALNVLNVHTPFPAARDIKSIIEYHIDLNFNSVFEKVQVIIHNDIDQPKELGFKVNYTRAVDTLKPKQYHVTMSLKTPFEVLKEIDLQGRMVLGDHIYQGNVTLITSNTYLSVAASTETEGRFLETSFGILLNTEVVPKYGCMAYFKKDFSEVDNCIEVQFEVTDNETINKIQLESSWHMDRSTLINADGKIQTTLLPLKLAESSILLTKGPNPQLNFELSLLGRNGHRLEYGTRASKKKDNFNVEIWTPMADFKNISMHGSLLRSTRNPNEYSVSGQLYRNMAEYGIRGNIRMANYDCYPEDVRLRIQPKAGGLDGVIELSIKEAVTNQKGMDLQFSAVEDGRMCQISGGYSVSDETGMDFSVLVQSTLPEIARININGKVLPRGQNGCFGEITLETPWKELGIESVLLRLDIDNRKNAGRVQGEYNIGQYVGRSSNTWTWILAEDMQLIFENYMEHPDATPRIVYVSAKYLNPEKNYQHLLTGGKLSVDSKWNLEINANINVRSSDDFQLDLTSHLPEPVGDVHHIGARYRGNFFSKSGQPNIFFESKYEAEIAKRRLLTRVSYRNVTDLQGLGHVEWGNIDDLSVMEGDFQMLRKPEVRREFYAKLITPQYKNQATFFANGNYDLKENEYHNLLCSFEYPASRKIAEVDIAIKDLSHMHGFVNCSTPFLNVTWLKADFNFSSNGDEHYRFCRATWPTDFAFFKLHRSYEYSSKELNHNLQGTIEMEVPLASRHRADIAYTLNERNNSDMGHIKVVYNEKQILDGLYKSTTERRHYMYIDTTEITLENDMKPLGIHYVNTKDFSNQEASLDVKHVEVFELRNAKLFNLTGELHTRMTLGGQELKIVAIHPNRTVVLTTNYEETSERVTKQRTKLELSETAWIGYNIEVGNYSKIGNDTQNFVIELFYPKRTLSTQGWYYMTDERFDSDISFKWSGDSYSDAQEGIRTGLLWQLEPLHRGDRDNQTIVFTVGHPYLEKDVTFKGTYYRGIRDLLKANLVIDYSENPEHLIQLGASIKDFYHELGHTNYTFKFFAQHEASELYAHFNGTAAAKPSYYKTESHALYRRSYYPEKLSVFLAKLDLNKKEVEYVRNSPYRSVRFWAIPNIDYPVYGLNATIWDTPDTNNTGYIYLNLDRKYARMEVNLTEDASQNLQMVGFIPDSRSAYLDIWRNYEEIRVIDVSSYIKMNHSRLITGRFHWQPAIKHELRDKIHSIGSSLYNSFSDGIDFWVKTLYSETMESVGVVWDKSKEYNRNFFDDVNKLTVLEQDLEDLRLFVNQSYEANDFYIKTVINFTLTILDELAIRDHIESLPKIFSEIWQAMGDSGKALRNSIVWLIETIKIGYNKMLDAISRFFHGESLGYLSSLLEKGVEKYDKFVKDLHISFIKYVEKLWNKFWSMMADYWKSVLKRFEPHIFKFISYIESAAWNLSKEVFDFIYKRSNELAESPYFNKVSSFTQDVDRLYKDIKSHDAITNIKKYSLIAWHFLKEKYFKLVPFGAELNEVLTEIWDEVKELQKIEQVQTIIQKYKEIVARLEWIGEELQLETRLHQLYALVRNKFRNYAMNALETADMYREAKTKFVFDPEVGIIDLEQKLPMSWHAFNETPKFEEIPEYKFLARAQNIFTTTNSSLIRYIYNLRTHLDPKTWLPPYYSRALLIGSRHYMTFDQRFIGLNLQSDPQSVQDRQHRCSYLLAHDFFQKNFTLILEPAMTKDGPDRVSTRKLSFIANGELIEINLGKDTLSINGDTRSMLPVQLRDVTIYRDLDILTVHSSTEYTLNCNVQFDLCWFEMSGWYFGQTAGLLGTMNNEQFDEFTTSKQNIVRNAEEFTDSWGLRSCKEQKSSMKSTVTGSRTTETCNLFFKSGILSACSDAIDIKPFYEMCLDLGSHSNALKPGHPAEKGACTAALAYIEACTAARIPLRIPEQCVFCQLANGSFVPEGTFVELRGPEVPRSSDVVFIVEAKPCNANLTESKNIISVVSTIEEQLQRVGITNNRYAVVAFGGRPPFDRPRPVIHENRVFTSDFRELRKYFDHIETNNGPNNDILQAISSASKLNFRPGVSKTFILLSCSNCAARSMRFDYSSILQYMLEEGVNLHILADTEFEFERTRKLRHFFGFDRDLVYSKRHLEGDAEIRKQLHIPKSNLGICTPLALETNGSVFSARKLMPERKYPIRRVANIFAKRVAKSAMPNESQTCECSGHNTGVAYVACSPSKLPTEQADMDDYDWQFSDWEWDIEDDDMEM